MKSITRISSGELDYSGIQAAENDLTKEQQGKSGSHPIDLLPTEKIEQPRNLKELGFDGEMAAEGVISLSELEDAYLQALEDGSKYVGQIMETALFEELEKEDPELLVTITEEINVHKEITSGVEATKYYMEWLDARNTAIEKRLERGTTPEGKAKIIRTWAAMRTLAKNEYIEKISELMSDEEKKRTALTAIQFVSTMQLLTETDILDEFTSSGTTSKQVMSKPAKAAATGILVGTLMQAGDFDGKLIEYTRKHMPKTTEYDRFGGNIESGVKAELYCMKLIAAQLEQMNIPGAREFSIEKTSRNEDGEGADIVVVGIVAGKRVGIFIDVKTAAQTAVGSVEVRDNGHAKLYDGGGEAPLSLKAWQVPAGMLRLVEDAATRHRDAFKGYPGQEYDEVKALCMRVVPGKTHEDDPLFSVKTQNCLRGAFA